jgi:hypothetical protein
MQINPRPHAAGAALIEFAMALPLFLLFVYVLLECARAMYLWSTLAEVTRAAARAAAMTDPGDQAAREQLRWRALFRGNPGGLPLAPGITQDNLRIEYLSQNAAGDMSPVAEALLPPCPARARFNCTRDPYAGDCIRFVRASVCLPGDLAICQPVPFQPLLPIGDWLGLALPPSTTLARAESLGYRPGEALCP